SPSLDVELALTDSETESNEKVPKINTGDQDEGQARPNPGIQDEGQAGPNPGVQDKGRAGLNPSDAAGSQPQPSHVVHAGPNLEPMDLEATDASPLQKPKQLDKEFTTTAYPNVQENLKLSSEDLDEDPKKTNAEAKVQSTVSVLIHQDTSSVPPMTTPVIDLTTSQSGSPLPTSSAITSTDMTTTTIPPPPPQPQQSTADPTLMKRIDELEQHMENLLQYNLAFDLPTVDMKEILQQQMFESKSYEAHEDHKKLKSRDVPRTPSGLPPPQPPPPPPLAGASGAPGSKASSSSKSAASAPYSMAWTTSDTRYESADVFETQELSPMDSLIQDDSIPDEHIHLSDNEDSENDHLPKADSRKDWWKPLLEEERPATLEPAWTIPSFNRYNKFLNWYYHQVNKTKLTQADLEGQSYEVVKAFYPDVINFQFQMGECHKLLTNQVDWTNPEGDQVKIDVNRPLSLDGPLGHVTIQSQFFFTKDLEYLRHGSKGSSLALSISKMKAASYPDFGLELLVPKQIHDSLSHRREVKKHMRILNVVRIKAFLRYRYDYLSEIVIRRADFQEHTIAKKDFKNLYPNDFKDLNLLLLQGHLDHL
nr:hypothetical protein [Tanacetum cinerariifolium]